MTGTDQPRVAVLLTDFNRLTLTTDRLLLVLLSQVTSELSVTRLEDFNLGSQQQILSSPKARPTQILMPRPRLEQCPRAS